ncbi:MAG: HAMP domain-containing histidine kinase [bacterium]|nr:MAG: HAMP domain-containing histidine kinase [bacterium]
MIKFLVMLLRKRLQHIIQPIVVLIVVQLTWLSLAALWIYFYISNHIIIEKVGNEVSPTLMPGSYHVLVLISGCILLVLLQGGFYFIYIYLNRQINVNRVQDHFIANITHELKSPLASIQLYLETLEARSVPVTKLQEFIQLMIRDTNRLQTMIDRILGTISIDQKRLAFDFKVFNMRSIIPLILKQISTKYTSDIKNNISLENPPSCRCVLDKDAFKIIFINLVDNAIKYAGGRFSLKIQCLCFEKYFRIEFIDQGVGIPAKERKQVFRKFYRIYGQEIPDVRGTGLGLYITKEIIRYHGGRIKALSAGKNMGTLIRIEMPIYKKAKKRYTIRLLRHTINRKKRSERTK